MAGCKSHLDLVLRAAAASEAVRHCTQGLWDLAQTTQAVKATLHVSTTDSEFQQCTLLLLGLQYRAAELSYAWSCALRGQVHVVELVDELGTTVLCYPVMLTSCLGHVCFVGHVSFEGYGDSTHGPSTLSTDSVWEVQEMHCGLRAALQHSHYAHAMP